MLIMIVVMTGAMKLAKDTDLVYCEGVVLFMSEGGRVYPMGHGWCSTKDGEVVDPTMWKSQTNPRELSIWGSNSKRVCERMAESCGVYRSVRWL